jgi:hypothetical protein
VEAARGTREEWEVNIYQIIILAVQIITIALNIYAMTQILAANKASKRLDDAIARIHDALAKRKRLADEIEEMAKHRKKWRGEA